jgi:taurine--2-oxoglutarate transaminase
MPHEFFDQTGTDRGNQWSPRAAAGVFSRAIDLVKNRATKEPMNTNAEKVQSRPLVTDKVDAAMMKEGVFVMSWVSHFVTGPPLIIEKSDIDFGVSVMDRALEIADQYVVA